MQPQKTTEVAEKPSNCHGATEPSSLSDEDDVVYPTGVQLTLVLTSIFIGMFLVSLDRLIISTAIPQITDEFNSAGDIGWYGTAYMLTTCAFQLFFGKLYVCFRIKHIFMAAIVLFEVGSAVCGAAPNSVAFIIGRSIAGLGSGGIMSGALVIVVYSLPLHQRPKIQGLFGAVFGISSIISPLIGGAFTTNVTWRWCFYLNLPVGGAVLVIIFFLLHTPARPSEQKPLKEKLEQLNVPGLLVILPAVVCLCLALQWGGTKYSWSEGRIIALLVLAVMLFITFAVLQILMPNMATVPPRIFSQRSILSGFLVSCCIGAHMTTIVYYLPIWFQAIQSVSAINSALHLLPMLISMLISTIGTGLLTSRIGYYTPFLIFGVCLTAIGLGLITTFTVDISEGIWIGYQILYGFGLGCCTQAPNMAAQTVLARVDVSIGASLMFFGQQLFGAIFSSVGQTALDNQLANRLDVIPGFTPRLIQSTGATELLSLVPPEDHAAALQSYNDSLRVCFQIALGMACLAIVGALSMEWRSVRKNLPKKNASKEGTAEAGETTHESGKEMVGEGGEGERGRGVSEI